MITREDYISELKKGHVEILAKMQFLHFENEFFDGSPLVEEILDYSININKNNGVRRSISVTLDNSDKKFLVDKDDIWVGTKFQFFLGAKIKGEEYWESQGIFIITNPNVSYDNRGNTFSIKGIDKFSVLDGQYTGFINDLVEIARNERVDTSIRLIMDDINLIGAKNKDPKPIIISPTDATLSYTVRKTYGNTIADILKELAFYESRNVYYDRFGNLRYEEDFDDTLKGSLWDFNYGEDRFTFDSMSQEKLFSNVFNVVKILGNNNLGETAVAIAKNTNPLSDTNINRIGEKIAKPIIDTRITTQARANDRALFELKKLIRLNTSSNITCLPIIFLDVDEVITVTIESMGIYKEPMVVNSLSFSSGEGGKMSIKATNTKELSLELEV